MEIKFVVDAGQIADAILDAGMQSDYPYKNITEIIVQVVNDVADREFTVDLIKKIIDDDMEIDVVRELRDYFADLCA